MAQDPVSEYEQKPDLAYEIPKFNRHHTQHISGQEAQLLQHNQELASAVFGHGLVKLLGPGSTTVTQLEQLSPQAWQILENKEIQAAIVRDKSVTVEQIGQLSGLSLSNAMDALKRNDVNAIIQSAKAMGAHKAEFSPISEVKHQDIAQLAIPVQTPKIPTGIAPKSPKFIV